MPCQIGSPHQGRSEVVTKFQVCTHKDYPLDAITVHCCASPSDSSSLGSPARPPSSHAEESEYSSATSLSGGSDMQRTQKGSSPPATHPLQAEDKVEKKKGFFSNSPFRRKSKSEKQHQQQLVQQQQKPSQQSQYQQYQQIQQTPKHTTPMKPPSLTSRRTWGAEPSQQFITDAPNNRNPARNSQSMAMGLRNSPEPIDPRASFQLNVGENVFDVAPPDGMRQQNPQQQQQAQRQEEEDPTLDPIAQALATLKGVAGNASVRKSADRYYGISTPAPQATPGVGNDVALAAKRGTPPPSYMTPKRSALDLPAPAFTSAQMQQSTQKYRQQTEHMLEGPPQMPAALQEAGSMGRSGSGQSNRERANTIDYHRSPSRQTTRDGNGPNGQELVRAASPNPSTMRSVSPRPQIHGDPHRFSTSPRPSIDYNRGPSPNPSYQAQSRPGTANMQSRNSGQGEYFQNPAQPPYQNQQARNSPSPHPMTGQELSQYRPYSPNPQALVQAQQQQQQRPRSQHGGSFNMDAHSGAVESFGRSRGRNSYYGGEDHGGGYVNGNQQLAQRPRSKSVVDIHRAQLSRDGRVILHYGMFSVVRNNFPSALFLLKQN